MLTIVIEQSIDDASAKPSTMYPTELSMVMTWLTIGTCHREIGGSIRTSVDA